MPKAQTRTPPSWTIDRSVRRIVASWRRLTGGGRVRDADRATLVACSGGADSSALVLALSTTGARIVVGHIVHDMRPDDRAAADRDTARALGDRLGIGFDEAHIAVADRAGNTEGEARAARYRALSAMARAHGCAFVGSGHHADDQLETLLMRLIRGAGLRGLGGVSPSRDIGDGVALIRPMLGVRRVEGERICALADWAWAIDETNTDESRLRSAIRHGAAAMLSELEPAAAEHAAEAAEMLRDAAGVIDDAAQLLLAEAEETSESFGWSRTRLGRERAVVVGALLRLSAERLLDGRGMDRVSGRAVRAAADAVRDGSTDPRRFVLHGVEIEITAHRVSVRRKESDE